MTAYTVHIVCIYIYSCIAVYTYWNNLIFPKTIFSIVKFTKLYSFGILYCLKFECNQTYFDHQTNTFEVI